MSGAVNARDVEAATGEELLYVVLHPMHGAPNTVMRDSIIALDLQGLAVAYRDADGLIHRVVGLPIEAVAKKTDSRIIRPA